MSKNVTQINNIDKLLASPGWRLLVEAMEKEIVEAAMIIADNPNMSLDEINFRRGSIWSAKQLLNLPHALRRRLESSELLERRDNKPR